MDTDSFQPTTADRLRRHVEILCSPGDRSLHLNEASMAEAQNYCSAQLVAAGWNVKRQDLHFTKKLGIRDDVGSWHPWPVRIYPELRGTNLVATRPGVEGPFLVLCGHLDSVKNTPGADDNASSVAVLLEVASALVHSELPIMIALLDMEEVGHFGGKALARRMSAESSAAMVINMDMVGFFSAEPRSQKLPLGRITSPSAARDLRARDYTGDFLFSLRRQAAAGLSADLVHYARGAGLDVIEIHDPRPQRGLRPLINALWPPFAHYDRSDHADFEAAGIPSVFVSDGAMTRSPHYHRSSDRPDTLDYSKMAYLVDALAATAHNFNWPS